MKSNCFNGLTTVNVELTSRCNKNCFMCGRRQLERDYPNSEITNWGDMDYSLVKKIAKQLPPQLVVQFHNNGEPTLYPNLGEALDLFKHDIRCLDTNGKLIVERIDEIIDKLETITISTFEGDDEADKQAEILDNFIELKGDRKPRVIIRCLGKSKYRDYYKERGFLIADRYFHDPMGCYEYDRPTTKPEIGICLDVLNHMSINRYGIVSHCVRLDPNWKGYIGDANRRPLLKIWNSSFRKGIIKRHIEGRREEVPLCKDCEHWGLPSGGL